MYKHKTNPAKQFTSLITNYKIVHYKNGDTLDLREKNLKEFGAVEVADGIKDIDTQQQFTYFKHFKMNTNILPKNVWLLGEPNGTIFNRKDEQYIYIYTARVTVKQKKPTY